MTDQKTEAAVKPGNPEIVAKPDNPEVTALKKDIAYFVDTLFRNKHLLGVTITIAWDDEAEDNVPTTIIRGQTNQLEITAALAAAASHTSEIMTNVLIKKALGDADKNDTQST